MSKKLKTKWEPGSEFLPPFTIEESANNLRFGDPTISMKKAIEMVKQYRKMVKQHNPDK
jgi:hypothetical protein